MVEKPDEMNGAKLFMKARTANIYGKITTLPEGYRLLRVGEIIRRGDKYLSTCPGAGWQLTSNAGQKVGQNPPVFGFRLVYIRRVKSAK